MKALLFAMFMFGGCAMERDYQTARVFGPSLESLDMRVKLRITSAEGADAEFQGALTGTTKQMLDSPAYASLVGRYNAVKLRLEADKTKWAEMQAWATSVKNDPVKSDLDKLNLTANTLQIDLGNVETTLRALPVEVTRIRMTDQVTNRSAATAR